MPETQLAETVHLSKAALTLLRHRLTTEDARVTVENLEAYRELARAGIMDPVSGMFGGPEANFRFTDQGWNRRGEWTALPAGSP